MNKLFVTNLADRVTQNDLERQFSKYGRVDHVAIRTNRQGRLNGFITFVDQHDAENAKNQANNQYFLGYRLRVDYARDGGNRGGRGARGGARGARGGGHQKNGFNSSAPGPTQTNGTSNSLVAGIHRYVSYSIKILCRATHG